MAVIQTRVARNELPWVSGPLPPSTLKVVESIPQVTLIEFHCVTPKQPAELILKGNFPVMLLLSCDVFLGRFNLRKANREDPVAILPGEILQIRSFGFQPQG